MTSRTTKRRAWIGVVLAVAVVSLLMTSLVGVAVSQEERATPHFDEGVDYWLTVLHNNDGESAVLTDGVEGGVDQFLLVRDRAERQAKKKPYGYRAPRGVIMVSSGDNFLASPSLEATFADGMFYDAMALNKLNYDAIILGNHDFDFGPDFLEDFIEMGFPAHRPPTYLSANLDFSMEPGLQDLVDDGIISGSTVVVERGKEIGIVGATTENLPIISSPRDVIVTDVATAAQAEIDALTAAGVDIIVFVSHLQGVGEDIALAAALTDVDIMIAGGGDELLANPDDLLLPSDDPADIFGAYPLFAVGADGADIPVVTTSGSYGYLGHLVVGFDEDGNVVEIDDDRTGPHRVVDKSVGSDGVGTERYMADKVQKPVNRFVKNLAKDIVGVSEVGLDGTRLPGVRSMETNEGNLIADSQMWQAQELAGDFGVNPADVAIQNGGGIRNDDIIPAGDISVADTFDMVPFGNQVVVFEDLPPATFLGLMENAV
jgi:5'-nucleotidase